MLKRKVTKDLLDWKLNHKNTCLMVFGARQVGKTFIIQKFAQENYEKVIYINFIEQEEFIKVFEGNLDSETILQQLTLYDSDLKIVPGKTLLFLDEIQMCDRAITALKFLATNHEIDCIASGSMLGIAYKKVTSFPVGYVERLEMHSLDFEEFCWANGMDEEAISVIKDYYDKQKTIPEFTHNKMLELFRNYIVVGGMPQVVENFKEYKHYGHVLKLQRTIIESYKDDIVKYTSDSDKIRKCFNSIPKHLAKENKKFRYSLVDKQGNAKKYYGSLEWLKDAGIISFCYNLSSPSLPLEGSAKEDVFKVYMRDTGLLVAMLEDGSQNDIINGNLGIYKGAIYENIIADIFTKSGKKLYYFEHNSTLEIDFFIRYKDFLTAVEVKSADNTKSKSLNSVMTKWNVQQAIRLSTKNLGYSMEKNIYIIPLYMSMFI